MNDICCDQTSSPHGSKCTKCACLSVCDVVSKCTDASCTAEVNSIHQRFCFNRFESNTESHDRRCVLYMFVGWLCYHRRNVCQLHPLLPAGRPRGTTIWGYPLVDHLELPSGTTRWSTTWNYHLELPAGRPGSM